MKQTLWCCVNFGFKEPVYYFPSLQISKHGSILSLKSLSIMSWEDLKKFGWKCIKVSVEIKPL